MVETLLCHVTTTHTSMQLQLMVQVCVLYSAYWFLGCQDSCTFPSMWVYQYSPSPTVFAIVYLLFTSVEYMFSYWTLHLFSLFVHTRFSIVSQSP